MRVGSDLLDRVIQVRGIRGAILVTESDGLVVAEALSAGVQGAPIAALAASLTQRIRRAARAAGLAPPTVVQLRADGGAIVTVPAGDDLLLVAIAERSANLGLARLELRDVASRLFA